MSHLADTVILLAVLQGAVMCVVLAARRTDRLANRFLGALIGGVALMLLLGWVNGRWGFHGHPHLLGLGAPLPFLFGPLLYLYIAALTRPIARFDPRSSIHALPFVAFVLFMLQAFYLKTGDDKLAMARESMERGGALPYRLVNALQVVQALAYVAASWLALRRYGRKIEGYYSDLTRIDLRWLAAMVLAHGVVWSTVLASNAIQALGMGGPVVLGLKRTIQIGSAFVVFLSGYVSLWQPELFQKARAAQAAEADEDEPSTDSARVLAPSEPPLAPLAPSAPEPSPESASNPAPAAGPGADVLDATPPAPPPPRPKYQRNRLDDRDAEELAQKLRALMERDEAYRDASLTLSTLADSLGATPHLLSQVLNVRIGKSFYVFVNSYRTEALKAALSDPGRMERGVLELALEAGFNSKSTLNSFFKKQTGLTPTEFRRRAQDQTRVSPAGKVAGISRG